MIEVFRLNHRIGRDPRISTHFFLTARAFGASNGYYSGERDKSLEESINKIVNKFGGNFKIEFIENDIKFIENKKKNNFKIVHLTMYGKPVQERIKAIKKSKNILTVAGGEKVEPVFYNISDYNIAITNQPHSEVAALCNFLDFYFDRKELYKEFENPKVKIIGKDKGKDVIEL